MKKFISVIIIAVMIASLIPAIVNAEADDELGNVIVPYIDGTGITIDGTLDQGEWSENDKIALNENNLSGWAVETYEGPIDFYYSWGEDGLYMAAVVYDDQIAKGLAADGVLSTRFQIALNPAGIICYPWAGLFFSITPLAGSDEVRLMRHNWTSNDDNGYFVEADSGFVGKYTLRKDGETVIGWNMECIIPWDMIASADRGMDLDVTDEIYLTNFDPKDTNRKRAFCTAMICYVQCNDERGSVIATGRTSRTDAGEWTVDAYDITLLFALPGEERSTETEYFVADEGETTDEETIADTEENDTDTETDAETDDETNIETVTNTEEVENTTTTAPVDNNNGGLGTGAIIGIIVAAVAVVAAVVVAVVLGKKKKA